MSLTSQKQEVVEAAQADDIETLRQILIVQRGQDIPYAEAAEVGATLVEFYELLATEEDDERDH